MEVLADGDVFEGEAGLVAVRHKGQLAIDLIVPPHTALVQCHFLFTRERSAFGGVVAVESEADGFGGEEAYGEGRLSPRPPYQGGSGYI